MTTVEHEDSPPGGSFPETWEAMPVPEDFCIKIDTEVDQEEEHAVEAYWAGEAKVVAQVEPISEELFIISDVRRPDFWGPDTRPAIDQQREYEMGLNGMIASLVAKGATGIELAYYQGIPAAAAAKMRLYGWDMRWRSDAYWTSGNFSLEDAISTGNKVSIRFDKLPAVPIEIGGLATGSALRDVAELSATE